VRALASTACVLWLAACGGGRPTANAGPFERTGNPGEVMTFDGSASKGTIEFYSWDFGDGSATGEGEVVTHTFAQSGNFSVTLTVVGPGGRHSTSVAVNIGGGCNATAAIVVATTNPQPGAPVVLNGGTSKGCNNASIVSYAWDFGDGQTESGDASKASVTHTWATQGIYTVALTVKDTNMAEGRATRSLGVGVAVSKPAVTCPGTASATLGVPTSFSASGTDPGGRPMTYAWTFSDGGSAMGSPVQHTFATAGSFTAQVTATTDDARVSDPCTVNVTVAAPVNFSGTWLLNPASASLGGNCPYSTGFPATHLNLVHTGNSIDATPTGNSFPAGQVLTGTEDPPPAAPGNFTVRKTLPNEQKAGCSNTGGPSGVDPAHSVSLTFNSTANPMSVSGTWRIVYSTNPACTVAQCINCNCVATGTFSGIKQ
jgi:PKD repeat protein